MKRNWSSPPVSVLQHAMSSVNMNTTVFACLATVVDESHTQSWYDEDRRSPTVQPWLQEDKRGSLLEGKGSPPSSSEGIPCEFCGESFAMAHLYSHQVRQNPVLYATTALFNSGSIGVLTTLYSMVTYSYVLCNSSMLLCNTPKMAAIISAVFLTTSWVGFMSKKP